MFVCCLSKTERKKSGDIVKKIPVGPIVTLRTSEKEYHNFQQPHQLCSSLIFIFVLTLSWEGERLFLP